MAPEQLGLLPAHLGLGNEYTTAVDMWALGFMVHELLIGRTPFLETPVETLSSGYPTAETGVVATDMRLMLQFCDGDVGLPLEPLQAIDASAIQFVKSLVVPDPRARSSAALALLNPWITGEPLAEPQADTQHLQVDPPMYYKGGYVVPAPPYNPWALEQSSSSQPRPISETNRPVENILQGPPPDAALFELRNNERGA